MRINIEPTKLAAYRLTVADVEGALRAQNVEIPAGRIESRLRSSTCWQTDLQTPEGVRRHRRCARSWLPDPASAMSRRSKSAPPRRGFQRFMGKNGGLWHHPAIDG